MKKQFMLFVLFLCASSFIFAQGQVCINSIGFLPNSPKKVSVTQPCETFIIKNLDGAQVFKGKVTGPITQNDVEQKVWLADFTDFDKSGDFFVEIPNVGKSAVFKIGDDVYNDAFYASTRAMYLWRCGTAVKGEHNGIVYEHDICHMDDGYEDYIGNKDQQRDGTGGWHDAGDHGKYIVNAGITVASMFLAWDHFQDRLGNFELDIPETAPGYPDYLEEIKWETDWVLKMQYPDGSGKISHKLTRTNFSGFIMPEDDDEKRYFTEWSTAATADFIAMMAMAARYFKPYDTKYAEKCLDAAKNSYNVLVENPEPKRWRQGDFRTGAYGTGDADDRMWAAVELWETTGDEKYLTDFQEKAKVFKPFRRRGEAQGSVLKIDEDWDWGNVRNLAMFTFLLSDRDGKDKDLFDEIKNDLIATSDSIVARAQNDVYGRPLERYYWGCNGTIARQAINLQVANMLEPKKEYLETIHDGLSHLFGRNFYNRSFVTGLGHNPPMFPHDRRSGADGIEAPWPGYIVGGGHNAKDWVDEEASYATNEVAINWQGALIYALAGFVK